MRARDRRLLGPDEDGLGPAALHPRQPREPDGRGRRQRRVHEAAAGERRGLREEGARDGGQGARGLSGGGGGDGGGGGGGGGEYSPPSPPETIIIIPATPSQPVIVQQPKKSGVKPARDVKVSKVESTTLIQIAPKPLITLGSSDIAIQGLNKGQYIRVTVTGVNGASQVITPSDNSELNTIINNNPKSKLEIEITPTLSSALKTGARIRINGAKKNQRVRVTVQ